MSEVAHIQDLSHELRRSPDDPEVRRAAQETHSRLRALQDRLRLTSKSVATQEAARRLQRYSYYQWRSTIGGRGEFWSAHEEIRTWLTAFNVAAREELGLAGSSVYQDPPEGFPIPGDRPRSAAESEADPAAP